MKKIFTLTIAVAAAFLSKAQDITIDFNETHVPEGVYAYDDVEMRIRPDAEMIIPDLGGILVPGRYDAASDAYFISGAVVLDFTDLPYSVEKVKIHHNGAFYMYHPYPDPGGFGVTPLSIGLVSPLDSLEFDESPDSVVISSVVPASASVSKIEIFLEGPSSTNALSEKNPLLAYPNPVQNSLIINSTGDASSEVTVSDLAGKQVVNTTLDLTSNQTIDFSNLPKGLYLVSVQSNHQTYTTRVTK